MVICVNCGDKHESSQRINLQRRGNIIVSHCPKCGESGYSVSLRHSLLRKNKTPQ